MSLYNEARTLAMDLIGSTRYSLYDNYADMWILRIVMAELIQKLFFL